MNPTIASIVDLSPAEKLQLVEDLWDDLAATPEALPIHDWQKEVLSRRKANLMKNPGSGLSWEEIKRRVRIHYGGWIDHSESQVTVYGIWHTSRDPAKRRQRLP